MIRKFSFLLLVLTLQAIAAGSNNQPDGFREKLASMIKSGDVKGIAGDFDVMVDLAIPGNSATCSKAQATRILQSFFEQNTVKNFRIERNGTADDGSEYFAGTLDTSKKRFTLSVRYRARGDKNLIYQFRIVE